MRSFLSRVVALVALSFTLVPVAGCGTPMGGPGGPGGPGHHEPSPGAGHGANTAPNASCDPAGCADFCWYAGCLFSENPDATVCKAACASRCGDGLFDDADAAVMKCSLAAGMQIDCSGARTCCADNITSGLCGE